MTNDETLTSEPSQESVPDEILGKSLGIDISSDSQSDLIAVTLKSDELKENKYLSVGEYAQILHGYILNQISSADKKASFVFALGAAFLVFLYESELASFWTTNIAHWGLVETLKFTASVGLAVSCCLSAAVVVPRLEGSPRGLVYWKSIATYQTAKEYSDEIQKLPSIALSDELLKHSHELSGICARKFRVLNWALRLGSVGAIATILMLVIG